MSTLKFLATVLAVGAAGLTIHQDALAEEDCFNGPVTVDGAQRGEVSVAPGHAVRMTFTFNALYENQVFICDALTGEKVATRGNYNRLRDDWVSPIDNTRSLAYYIVAFHKTVRQTSPEAFRKPWIQSALKTDARQVDVPGLSEAKAQTFGFSDGGGPGWDNAVVTAYTIGSIPVLGPVSPATAAKVHALVVTR